MKYFIFLSLLFISCTNLYSDVQNNSSFFKAVYNGDLRLVEKFLDSGTNTNIKDSSGRTALMIATYNNDVNMVDMLVGSGADVNIQDNILNSPFLYAGASGYLDIVKLTYKNSDTRNVLNRYGGNALIPACEKGHYDTVKFLLENTDIDVNLINNLGWTALLEVTILGGDGDNYVKIVELLLKHGANKNIRDKNSKTALDYARERKLIKIELLLR